MDVEQLVAKLEEDEGFAAKPYKDTVGVLTFGYGFTFVTKQEAKMLLRMKAANAVIDAATQYASVWNVLTPVRQRVLAEMAYQLGPEGLAAFRKFKAAVEAADHAAAAAELLDSVVAREQTPARWQRHAADWSQG